MKAAVRHLEFEEIIRLAQPETASNFAPDKQKHRANCAECAAQVNKLANLFSLAPKTFAEDVPQAVTANLLNIYRKPAAKPQKTLTTLLAGLPIFDDWKPEFALNERLSFQDTRQFLYRAGNYNVDLRVQFADDKYLVSGQLFPETRSAVVRIHTAKFSAETNLNEYGEFNFAPVEKGIFNLQIVLEKETIEINEISLS